MKIRNQRGNEKNELNMTSMIDIVFLLLVFFVMTFKVVELEGDFSVRMPLGESGGVPDPTDLGLKLRLRSDSEGHLAGMSLNDADLGTNFDELRARIVSQLGSSAPGEDDEGPEIEIDTDYNLRYENVIKSITAVSGYKDGNGVVKLIEKIKFAKPRR